MKVDATQNSFRNVIERAENVLDFFDEENLKKDLEQTEKQASDFEKMQDASYSKSVLVKLKQLEERVGQINKIKDFISLGKESGVEDNELVELLSQEAEEVDGLLEKLELEHLFSGANDKCDALVEIHSGAGGEDAQDWAEILANMYIKYAQKTGLNVEIISATDGDGAGIKSETLKISGLNCYGMLKFETGVHRLVRISPFDSNSRRHTSFASVQVLPVIEDDCSVKINDDELKIDTYRSGGAGGQNVNKTESAVRITHLPTGIVVSCQNERSQIKNKEVAMSILKSKLALLREAEKNAEKDRILALQKKIEWGNQIRSYVFAPYTQVKDLRTGATTSNVQKFIGGDLDEFISAELKFFAKKGE
ncbi:MAG: peptide chain release factor 2 [Clostridia bacterium]|nr:peptide chain release factor 2 [Clostridia bacterium]